MSETYDDDRDDERTATVEGKIKGSKPVKKFRKNKVVRKVLDGIDMHCDMCGKRMKPGGNYTKSFGDREYQFCSMKCADMYDPKWDIIQDL